MIDDMMYTMEEAKKDEQAAAEAQRRSEEAAAAPAKVLLGTRTETHTEVVVLSHNRCSHRPSLDLSPLAPPQSRLSPLRGASSAASHPCDRVVAASIQPCWVANASCADTG